MRAPTANDQVIDLEAISWSEQEGFSPSFQGLLLLSMKEAGQILFRNRFDPCLIGGTFIKRLLPLGFEAFDITPGASFPPELNVIYRLGNVYSNEYMNPAADIDCDAPAMTLGIHRSKPRVSIIAFTFVPKRHWKSFPHLTTRRHLPNDKKTRSNPAWLDRSRPVRSIMTGGSMQDYDGTSNSRNGLTGHCGAIPASQSGLPRSEKKFCSSFRQERICRSIQSVLGLVQVKDFFGVIAFQCAPIYFLSFR